MIVNAERVVAGAKAAVIASVATAITTVRFDIIYIYISMFFKI